MKITSMSVELIDHMGSDLSVVNAARVSFNKESKWKEDLGPENWQCELEERDIKLINYLAKHNHWTPFAHCFLSFRVKAPIFVARQLVKHQVGLAWNEVSRRYVDEEPEFWFPKAWRTRPDGSIKQGSGVEITACPTMDLDIYPKNIVQRCLNLYFDLLTEGNVAPEMARMILPQNTMTEWIWSGSLMAFCRVCRLRLDPHAQEETRELVGAIKALLEPLFPVSVKALLEN